MTNSNENRDEVLFAFYQACARPTVDDILSWTRRFPQFADDIRAHAAVRRDWDACEDLPVREPDESMIARGYADAIVAIERGDFHPTPDARRCPNCQCYFMCGP